MVFSLDLTADHRPLGFVYGAERVGLKESGDIDLAWLGASSHAGVATPAAAGLFSSSSLSAPAVRLSMEHLSASRNLARGILVHAGVANVATGNEGHADAEQLLHKLAQKLQCQTQQLLICGTGVMGLRLPKTAIEQALDPLIDNAQADRAMDFSTAILTTDRSTKIASATGIAGDRVVRVLGIAKGNRMVHPRLCTMLVFLLTDAKLPAPVLRTLMEESRHVFEGISVDGVSSPADSVLALANGAAGGPDVELSSPSYRVIKAGWTAVCQSLAYQIVEDGTLVTRAVCRAQVSVSSAPTNEVARHLVDAVAANPLVKEALGLSEACLGEVLAALSTAPVEVDFSRVSIAFDGVVAMKSGAVTNSHCDRTERIFQKKLAVIRIDLGSGTSSTTRWVSAGLRPFTP